jgi:hypothetical protein
MESLLCMAGQRRFVSLFLQAPAPMVARMLGYTHDHPARLVAEAGGTWARYAPGDHSQ